jgi:hypothetical protein
MWINRFLTPRFMLAPDTGAGSGAAGTGEAAKPVAVAGAAGTAGAAAGAGAEAGAAGAAAAAAAAGTGAGAGAGAAVAGDRGGAAAADAGAGAGAGSKAAWPEDWRNQAAGDDKKLLEQLGRYSDPLAAIKKGFEFEKRLSAGELKSQLPAGATPEQVKAWRTENGIPVEDKAYVDALALPKGVVLGDENKANVDAFAKVSNELGLDTKSFNRLVAWSYEAADREKALREDADAAFAKNSEDKLRDVWKTSADYNRNENAVSNLLGQMPEGLADQFRLARMPNGNIVGNDPGMMQFMARMALELDPAAPLLPHGSSGGAAGAEARLAEIRKFRTDNPQGYDSDKKMQEEEVALIDAQLRMNKRRA